jgi:phospholipid/cholesterol/gamma-HCH transport system substrate-binding protein
MGVPMAVMVMMAFVVMGLFSYQRLSLDQFPNIDFPTVVVSMDQRYKFPTDSSAKILTSGLLGEQYLGLEAGAEEKTLGEGDRIRMTQSAVVLENLISQFLFSKAEQGVKKE